MVLSDCSSTLQKVAAIESGTCEYYSDTHAYKLSPYLAQNSPGPECQTGSHRAHVGFAGDEWADMFARRAGYVNPPPPPSIPMFHLHRGDILISESHTTTFSDTSSPSMLTPTYIIGLLIFGGTPLFSLG